MFNSIIKPFRGRASCKWNGAAASCLFLRLIVLGIIGLPAVAQGPLAQWLGVWDLNVDGFQHQFAVKISDRECDSPAWCRLDAGYRDHVGHTFLTKIISMDRPEHMTFAIALPGGA